jgi:hypothetical protein
MRYRILSLPDHRVLSIPALEAVAGLVKAGATAVGPKPQRTVSLTGYPRCDEQLARLSEELWGTNLDDAGMKTVGKGRMLWGKTSRQVLAEDGVPPDFEYRVQGEPVVLDYIHRQLDGEDAYFVCNPSDREVQAECRFRAAGRTPEIWDPLTGGIKQADNISQAGERTHISISFAPYGSWFVVFRSTSAPPVSSTTGATGLLRRLDGPWNVAFLSPWGDTFETTMAELVDWTEHPDDRIRHHSGKAIYECTFEMPAIQLKQKARLLLDLGRVEDVGIARVLVNDKDLGIVWTKPFRVDISTATAAGTNRLRVEVINSWRNRLIGDQRLAADQRKTATNIAVAPNWKLTNSGLLGPVTILRETQGQNR